MKRIGYFMVICLGAWLAACSPAGLQFTAAVSTAVSGTVEPETGTQPPPAYTPPATLPGDLGPAELKYRLLAEFPDLFFCDPDYYPVAREDELDLALQRFPELQADSEEFEAILEHNGLARQATFNDEQKLLIYREHKQLAAIPFELSGDSYRFQMQLAKVEGEGELVSGTVDGQGKITVEQRQPSFAACPICLAAGTVIDTPAGPVPVERLRAGDLVWTVNQAGERVARPLDRTSRTAVPANHQVVHLLLEDGRELIVSPGHPVIGGRRMGELRAGDTLDGARVISVLRAPYAEPATYDLLPASETGFYWANGILIASTLIN